MFSYYPSVKKIYKLLDFHCQWDYIGFMIIYGNSGKEVIKMIVDSIWFYPILFIAMMAILYWFS